MDVRLGLTHTILPQSSPPVIQVDRREGWASLEPADGHRVSQRQPEVDKEWGTVV